MTGLSRRAALGALGVGAAAGVGIGAGLLIDHHASAPPGSTGSAADTSVTVASWVRTRGDTYFIGHRGSGDVYPEHSMEAYSGAVAGGATCLEVSVTMTSDGYLVCMHDLTYDRTTTAKGKVADLPSTVLRSVRLTAPQLGPAWSLAPQPQVPLLDDVLRTFGGRQILCVEAKDDGAYPAVMAAVQSYGLQDSVIAKVYYSSSRVTEAKAAGFPVFAYFGSVSDVTVDRIKALAGQLDPARDYLILPTGVSDSSVAQAIATGIPIWVFPVHRRSEVSHFVALGCHGIISSSLPYASTNQSTATSDTWEFGAIAPGEMTKDPASAAYAPTWSGNELHLGAKGAQHFLTLGQFGPLATAARSYSVRFEATWPSLPSTATDNMTLAFAHSDDAYYQHRSGSGDGYHAILRANGSLELFRHRNGVQDGVALAKPVVTKAPAAGQWMKFELKVSPTTITWSRVDVPDAVITADDGSVRGGYLHIGRSSTDGELAFRSFSVG